jgi:plasmid stability protein
MATITIRDVPDEVCEALRRRAQRAGQSLESYLRDQIVTSARRPATKAEAIEMIEARLARYPRLDVSAESIVADIEAERR